MRPLAALLILAALTVFVAGCPERSPSTAVPPKGLDPAAAAKPNEAPVVDPNAPAGRKVFDANKCFKCHRLEDGAPGKGKAPNLAHVGTKRSAEWIAAHGRDPKTHGGKMPAYSEAKISDADLKTLSEYLASLK